MDKLVKENPNDSVLLIRKHGRIMQLKSPFFQTEKNQNQQPKVI